MYEGIKQNGKIDIDVEYSWYMESISLNAEGLSVEAGQLLFGMFCGAMRIVMGHKWLKDCPEHIDVHGIKVTTDIRSNELGRNYNDFMGNCDIIFSFERVEEPMAEVTTAASLANILGTMERFIRARFGIKEPEDLAKFILEQQRKDLILKHFDGIIKNI